MEEIKELIDQLNKYSYDYYTKNGENCPSDETYDKLYDELLQLEKETGIIYSNSPTQKVGNVILDKLQKVTHEYPLLSLDKTKSIDELIKWTNNKDCVLMHKLDGLTIDITYENGKLVKAETRGNGVEGELITENVKQFTNVPLIISDKRKLHVAGEAIITFDVFTEINSKLPQDKQYKNPRNLVSGSVRQLDSSICKSRKVKFIAYNLFGSDLIFKHQHLDYMKELGFSVVEWYSTYDLLPSYNIEGLIEDLKQKAKDLQLPIDGLVITYNDIEYGESLGRTSKFPLHSLAFKFYNDVEITKLINVEWNTGRIGVITPIAVFEDVELYGTTVNRASLHNVSIFKQFKLGMGDEITTTKMNEIIPAVIENITKSNTLQIPSICPSCGGETKIVSSDNSEVLICTNPNCKAKLVQQISHYVSRNAMNIDGLSEKTIEKLIDLELLKSIQYIYYLTNDKAKEIIIKQDGFGIKSYKNLVQAIEKSKHCKLQNLIFGLGIPNVGLSTAKNIVEYCKGDIPIETINNITSLPKHKWLDMKDCGEIVANSIYEWFHNQCNLTMLGYLTQCELIFEEDKKVEVQNNDNILFGKKVYPTGKFSLNKTELKIKLEELGAVVSSGYAKSLDYLICGGDTSKSGKVDKARIDNVKTMTEEELLSLLN